MLIGTNVLGPVVCNSLHVSKLVRTIRPEVIPPNSTILVKGITRPWADEANVLAVAEAADEPALAMLPGGVRVTHSLLDMSCQHSTTKVQVQLQNFTDKALTIPPKAVLCTPNRVEIPDSDDLLVSDSIVGHDTKGLVDMFDFSHCIFSVMGHCDLVKHQINLVDVSPIKLPHRRIPPAMVQETKYHLNKMLDAGIIRSSHTPFLLQWYSLGKSQVNYK